MASFMYMGKGAGSAPSAPPPYDFEDLESRFQIHKYIPKYFHNYDYSTPVIKDLIADKPIYAKANQHVKCCVSGGEKKSKRQLHKEYKEEKRDMRQEKKLLHKEYKHEKKELKKDYRSARRESRKVSRNHEGAEGDSGGAEVKYFKSWDKPLAEPKPFKITEGRYPDEAVNFQNPFLPVPEKAEIPPAAVPAAARAVVPATDAVPVPIKTRNNSLARKFKNLMKSSDNHNGEHNNSDKSSPSRRGSVISGLHPSTSYDQTKLSMTTSRTKGLLNKLISGDRRMSEQPGTYKKNKNKKKKKKWIISISSLSLCNAGFKLDQMNSNFIANFMLKNNANF